MSDLGANCASSCRTKDHKSWGECVRSQRHHVAYCQEWKGVDATKQKKWDQELQMYRDAKAQGIQPDGTTKKAVEDAVRISNEAGVGYNFQAVANTKLETLR